MGTMTVMDRLQLCRRGILGCVNWLKNLSKVSDPGDQPLQHFLAKLARDSERNLVALNEFASQYGESPERGSEDRAFDTILRNSFPSMSRGLGEGYLGRDSGMHFAECIEEELTRFYQSLAEGTVDPEAKVFFLQAGIEEESHLETVRHVILR